MTDRDQQVGGSPADPSAARPEHLASKGKDEGRGGFLGFVAHEMRNPLSTALWSAELLARLAPDDRAGPRGEKLAGMCLRALQRLRYLVEDHFLAERLDVAGIPLRPEPVSLREAFDAVAPRAGVASALSLGGEDVVVVADRGLLERSLEGVLAVAGKGSTPVRVDVGASDGAALVQVHGAPPAADALVPPQKGTGSDPTGRALALHMAQRAAAAMGGSLRLVGDGYLVTIPLAPGADQ